MSGNNITDIIKSPAFTIIVATVCAIIVMNRMPVLMTAIKEMKKRD